MNTAKKTQFPSKIKSKIRHACVYYNVETKNAQAEREASHGEEFSSIQNLTNYRCSKHPNGYHNGYHAPSMV